MKLHVSAITLILFALPWLVGAQSIDKKILASLPDTSACRLQKLELNVHGDKFCYYYREAPYILTTECGVYGPFDKQDRRFSSTVFYNEAGKQQYIKPGFGAGVYGPYDGEIRSECDNRVGDIAYNVLVNDSIRYYINGILIATIHEDVVDCLSGWCDFSDYGNVIYTIITGEWNYLYVNHKLLDSSKTYYTRLEIGDGNNYRYVMGEYTIGKVGCRGSLVPTSHKPQHIFSPMPGRPMYFSYDDMLHYYGNDNGVEDIHHRPYDIKDQNWDISCKGTTVFAYTDGRIRNAHVYAQDTLPTRVCINGDCYNLPYSEIVTTDIDSYGNYALIGMRDFYLYKNVNGIEQKEPLSKHGVRAVPISLDVHGNTICYYETDDSVYIYQNDKLFRSCTIEQFNATPLTINDSAYFIHNNEFSPPLLALADRYERGVFNIGAFIYDWHKDYGYWLIQKTGDDNYRMLINNKEIPIPSNLTLGPPLLMNLTFYYKLTAKDFTFYGLEGKNLCRYKVKL